MRIDASGDWMITDSLRASNRPPCTCARMTSGRMRQPEHDGFRPIFRRTVQLHRRFDLSFRHARTNVETEGPKVAHALLQLDDFAGFEPSPRDHGE